MQKKFEFYKLIAPSYKYNQDTDICRICLDLLIEPVKCSTCQSSFCSYCANRWRKDGKICPNRCSKQWKFEPSPPLQLKLKCPYECELLVVPNELVQHYKNCKLGPPRPSQQDLRLNYHCSNDHPLQYISNPASVACDIECAGCYVSKSICRSICTQCRSNGQQLFRYCCQCRFPKGLTKSRCSVGHEDFYLKPAFKCKFTTCDICSTKILANGNGCVEDRLCDVAICAKCYEKMQDGPGPVLDLKSFIESKPQEPQQVAAEDQPINMVHILELDPFDAQSQTMSIQPNEGQISNNIFFQPNQNGWMALEAEFQNAESPLEDYAHLD